MEIIEKHLKHVEKKNYHQIAREIGCSMPEVIDAVKIISQMEPKPGRMFPGEEAHYITPDVYVHKIGDEYITVLNEDGLPKLRISSYYQTALLSNPDSKTKEFIQDKFKSAIWLIRSIHQRQNTIRKVTESIMKFQRDFLDRGVEYLRPLILRDVAEDTGLHESTVSRVTTNKYVHTSQGIFELKFFFNSRISGVFGDDVSSVTVKTKIKHLVESENPSSPLSDQQIVEILKRDNIDIARRTVAKYREMIGILPSCKRKKLF
jgi:RNA polymerase sigma-54 factor